MNIYGNTQNSGSDNPENNDNNKPLKSTREIRQELQEHVAFSEFEIEFGKLMTELHKEVSDFSDCLAVEYHVVVFNRKLNTRFTILETKQGIGSLKDEDNKANNFGLVGKLFDRKVTEEFLMIQYGYHSEPIVYHNLDDGTIEDMPEYSLSNFWEDNENKKYYWATTGKKTFSKNEQERKFAIAAMLFYEEGNNRPLGAISLDFNTRNKKYPNFSFRKNEIQIIYKTMYRMKCILELILSPKVIKELNKAIAIAKQEDNYNENT